jgi:hypothetical protein
VEKKKHFFLMRPGGKAAIFTGVLLCAIFLVTATYAQSDTLNVGLTIPTFNPPPPPPPPPPPVDNPPVITSVTSTVSLTSATISWTATDDKGLGNSTIVYGQTTGYGSSGTVTGSYTTSLASLVSGTTYYFQINVTDTGGNNVVYTGTFNTLAADITAPNISSIVVTTSSNSANISWNTNEAADAQLQYGTSVAYGFSVSNTAFLLNHSVVINSLAPVTQYHYRIIATDSVGNATSTPDRTFTTAPDVTPPVDVSNLNLSATTSTISLTWINPSDADFLNVRVIRKAGSQPTTPADGTLLYNGANTFLNDSTAVANVQYFYMVYSYDTSGNRSGGTFVNGILATPPNEICNNNIDDNFNGLIDCADSVCTNSPVCAPPQNEICNNGIDDNQNGFTDCADSACSNTASCVPTLIEICGNGIDDNNNNLIDCADSACVNNQACKSPGGGGSITPPEMCSNGFDDDNNGKVDCADSACIGYPGCIFIPATTTTPGTTTTVPVVPEGNVPSSAKLSANDFQFFTGNRRIEAKQYNGTITSLAGTNFTIGIAVEKLSSKPESIHITFDETNHAFGLDSSEKNYYADFAFPQIGSHEAIIEIIYSEGKQDVIKINLQSLPLGQVLAGKTPLVDSTVTLFDLTSNKEFEAGSYGLHNPTQSSVNGTFGWVVPNGKYYITAVKDGYYTRKTPVFTVTNNVVNSQIILIHFPPKLDLNPANIAKIVEIGAQIGIQKITDTLVGVMDIAANPQVQETMTTVVAPSVVGVVAVGTVAVVSWANIIPLLQLLFLQPLVFFGNRRKREAWGQIYNSLNKLPVDLATVRLINNESGRVIQSKVTDNQGRYAFVINPGTYRIQVLKNNFIFPSELLKDAQNDGKKIDIYHGEAISVSEKEAIITANIPLDPVGEHMTPTRIRLQRAVHNGQMIIWWVGLFINAAAIYFSPRWYLWILLALQFVFYALLRYMAAPAKIKSWGIVYDITNKQPVERAIARLFSLQFNKLVASQITDSKGRYYFLAGDNEYFITYEHPRFNPQKTATIDLKGRPTEAINVDIGLHPQVEKEVEHDIEVQPPQSLK